MGDRIPLVPKPVVDTTVPPHLIERFFKLGDDLHQTNEDIFAKLKKIYIYADRLMRETVAPQAACQKGCDHCCRVAVRLSTVEAMYIERNTDATRNELKASTPVEIVNTPCPLLKNGCCSVYRYRPIVCRTYYSMDSAEQCRDPSNEHWIFNTESSSILQRLCLSIAELNQGEPDADIRQFFGESAG